MSHPIQPQGNVHRTDGEQEATVSDRSGIPGQQVPAGEQTIDLRSGDRYGQNGQNRAEFDQDFDDQQALRQQNVTPPPYARPAGANPTVRTGPPRTDDSTVDRFGDHTVPDAAGTTARYRAARPFAEDAGTERAMPTTIPPDRQTVAAREKERFGGMSFGSGFFGWLTATGMAVLMLTLLTAAGVALGIASNDAVNQVVQDSQTDSGTAQTVGLVGGILLLVILFVAYFCGGYVAGRMARFSGAKQGLAVWLWALITTAILAAIGAVAGSQYNVLAQLNLPRIPVDEGSVTTAGIIAIGAAVVVALIGALLGGITGTRFHRKVDAVGFEDDVRAY